MILEYFKVFFFVIYLCSISKIISTMPRNIYSFLSLSFSCSGISISSYLRSIATFGNIYIYLSSRLFLHTVIFLSFYHCKKKLDHIVFPSRSFVSNLLFFIPLTYIQQFLKYITLYVTNILNLSLTRLNLINPIFEYPFLYFGIYLVYLWCHFLSSFYSINKSNCL